MDWPCIRRARRLGAMALVMTLVLSAPPPARAQIDSREGIALQNQLYQLRQEIQSLRGDVGRGGGGGGGGGDIAAQLLSRVQSMEEQVRQLRGRIDETRNLGERHYNDLQKRIEDLNFQLSLSRGEPRTGSASPVPPPFITPAPPPSAPPSSGPPVVTQAPPRPAQMEPMRPSPEMQTQPEPRPQIVLAPTPPPPPVVITPPMPRETIPLPPPPPPRAAIVNPPPEPAREMPPPPPPQVTRVEPPRPAPRPIPPPREPDASAPAPLATPDVTATALPANGRRTPELALQEGQAALARRDYTAAERSAREVMSNRASPRGYDGQFLLAQALAGQKQHAQSAIAFDDAYNRSRKGRHAQDALLGLAGALTAINERKAACETLSRLRTEFPQVRADLRDTITRTNERAGCGR